MTTKNLADSARTSSADPFVLATYATDGTTMATTLSGHSTTLSQAVDQLSAAGGTIPGLADLVTALSDLAADWYHLDEWALGVAAEFLAELEPGFTPDGSPFVMTVDNSALADGQLRFADRDEAIARAEELAAEYQTRLDAVADGEPLVWDPPGEGGIALATIERLGALVEAYQHDPAFAVTFAETLGVNGIVGLRDLYRNYADESRDADRPRGHDWSQDATEVWVDAQMAGVAGALTTAMDTRRATSPHIDAGARLGDEARLDEDWIDRFADYGGDAQLDYSLLVREADLPPDVLVAIGDCHLGDHFGHHDRGGPDDTELGSGPPAVTEADVNIAAAIAADADASLGWLASDGIATGTDNLELVLTSSTDVEIYGSFTDIVETGLTHPTDQPGRGALMEQAIRIVGDEDDGGLAVPRGMNDETAAATDTMRLVLAHSTAENMDVVHRMVTEDWPLAHLSQVPPEDVYITHDFLREVMLDDQAADAVTAGYGAYALEQLAVLPDEGIDTAHGDGLTDRADALREVGAVQGVIIQAENNALLGSVEERIGRQQQRAALVDDGVEGLAYAGGFIPIYGQAIGAIDTAAELAGLSVGSFSFPADYGELEEAQQQSIANKQDATVNFATLLAIADGADAPPVSSSVGLTDDEHRQFVDWVLAHYDEASHSALVHGYTNAADYLEYRR